METTKEESREKQAEKVITFLRRIGAFDFFQRLREDKEMANDISFEDYRDFLVRINGITRNIPTSKRKLDGDGVMLEGFIDEVAVPRQEDKEELLKQSFTSRTHLQSTEDIAYMFPAVLTAVHPFMDGNGRTSRILHSLLIHHPSEEDFEENLRKALGEDGRFDTPDINPSYVNRDVTEIIWSKNGLNEGELPANLTRLRTGEKVTSKNAVEFSKKFDADNRYCFLAMYKYLTSKELLDDVTKGKMDFPDFRLQEDYKAISLVKMEDIFSEDDWNNLLDEYFRIKKLSIEILIDIFVHPNDYKIPDSDTTLRDKFISEVKKNLASNQI